MSSEKSATTAAVSCSSSSPSSNQQQQYQHGKPPDGWECLVTMEDIDENNYVEYYCCSPNGGGGKWKPAKMEQTVIQQLLQTQFHNFVDRVHKTDCQAELKRLLKHGPPIYISDPHGLPMDDDNDNDNDDTHTHYYISKLWYCSTNTEISAKLNGAVEGEERQKLWNELKEFIVVEGKEEGDDDNDDNDNDQKKKKNHPS